MCVFLRKEKRKSIFLIKYECFLYNNVMLIKVLKPAYIEGGLGSM